MNPEKDQLVDFALSLLKPTAADPCESFVVITGGEKQDILYPDVYGPFESYRAAYKWVAELRNANIGGPDSYWPGSIVLEPFDGGYMGFVIVNKYACSDPDRCYFAGDEKDEDE